MCEGENHRGADDVWRLLTHTPASRAVATALCVSVSSALHSVSLYMQRFVSTLLCTAVCRRGEVVQQDDDGR